MAICYVPSTTNKASNIKLKDTNDNYTSNDVEGALEEINAQFKDISTIPKLSTICVKDESGNSLLTLDFDLMPKDKATVYLNDVFTSVQGNGILKIRRDGVEHTFGVLSTDYMFVTIGYKTSNNTLLITNTRKAMEFDFNTNKITNNELSGLNGKAGTSTVLTKGNTTEYAPTQDYHPATKKYVDDNLPHYNETLLFDISGENYNFFESNSYFNINALNLDETKQYAGEMGSITSAEKYTYDFVYSKENDALMCEENSIYIYNHKSYDETDFIEDTNSAVLTFAIKPMEVGEEEVNGYFRLYEIDKVELDSNCLSNDVSIKNSLTVGTRIGDIGIYSVAEGDSVTASAPTSHAEGCYTRANGYSSHAEGNNTTASGRASHAEGNSVEASGVSSHAEGMMTISSGGVSHAEGRGTIASSQYQHVQGKYNIEDTENKYAHIVGNGTSDTARSNAHTLDWSGNAWYQGKLSQDGTPTKDKDLVTKKYVDDKFKGISIFPLDKQTFLDAVDTGVLSDEHNQLVVDWFNEVNNDEDCYSCLLVRMIFDILSIENTEIRLTKVMFDGVDLIAYTVIINKSAENKITITLNTEEFSLTPKLE